MTTTATDLHGTVAEHVAAVNAQNEDAIVATFAGDAFVNDAHREFWGTGAIRRWVAKEMVGDKITLEVTEVIEHHGETIVRGRYDGEFDKTNLPDELILTNYFTVRDGKIVSADRDPQHPRVLIAAAKRTTDEVADAHRHSQRKGEAGRPAMRGNRASRWRSLLRSADARGSDRLGDQEIPGMAPLRRNGQLDSSTRQCCKHERAVTSAEVDAVRCTSV